MYLFRVTLLLLFFTIGCTSPNGSNATQKKDSVRAGEEPSTPPNFIMVLVDDLGYGDVGFNGCMDIPTPNIDRIAWEGVRFTDAYVTWSACGPSRAGIITGRYQDRFGFSRNPLFAPKDINQGLPLSEETLATVLKKANYQTAALGKWHLGAHPSQRPRQRGFDHFFGFLTGGHRYLPEEWTLANEYEVRSQYAAYKTKLLRDEERIEEKEYLTDALSRETVNYIRRFKDAPFFIYLAYNAPHGPLQATQRYLDRFSHIDEKKRRVYAAMVSAVDDGVGRILDELEDLGIADNTMVVFLSDNGGPEPHNGSDNGPLRGTKGQLYEGGIRVPFAIRWPGKITAETTYENPISSLDIFATMVANTGSDIPTKNDLDGVDLLPFLAGTNSEPPHRELFWNIHNKEHRAVRRGDLKWHATPDGADIFNLQDDIGENNALSEAEPLTANALKKMETQYELWRKEMIPPAFLGLSQNDEYNQLHPDRWGVPRSQEE